MLKSEQLLLCGLGRQEWHDRLSHTTDRPFPESPARSWTAVGNVSKAAEGICIVILWCFQRAHSRRWLFPFAARQDGGRPCCAELPSISLSRFRPNEVSTYSNSCFLPYSSELKFNSVCRTALCGLSIWRVQHTWDNFSEDWIYQTKGANFPSLLVLHCRQGWGGDRARGQVNLLIILT